MTGFEGQFIGVVALIGWSWGFAVLELLDQRLRPLSRRDLRVTTAPVLKGAVSVVYAVTASALYFGVQSIPWIAEEPWFSDSFFALDALRSGGWAYVWEDPVRLAATLALWFVLIGLLAACTHYWLPWVKDQRRWDRAVDRAKRRDEEAERRRVTWHESGLRGPWRRR